MAFEKIFLLVLTLGDFKKNLVWRSEMACNLAPFWIFFFASIHEGQYHVYRRVQCCCFSSLATLQKRTIFHSSNRDTLGDFLYIEDFFLQKKKSLRDVWTDAKERKSTERKKNKKFMIFKRKSNVLIKFQNKRIK